MITFLHLRFACQKCITGKRTHSCAHASGSELIEMRAKGRPTTQCAHCRSRRTHNSTGASPASPASPASLASLASLASPAYSQYPASTQPAIRSSGSHQKSAASAKHNRCVCGDGGVDRVKLRAALECIQTSANLEFAFTISSLAVDSTVDSLRNTPIHTVQIIGSGEALLKSLQCRFVSVDQIEFIPGMGVSPDNPCLCHITGECICGELPPSASSNKASKSTSGSKTKSSGGCCGSSSSSSSSPSALSSTDHSSQINMTPFMSQMSQMSQMVNLFDPLQSAATSDTSAYSLGSYGMPMGLMMPMMMPPYGFEYPSMPGMPDPTLWTSPAMVSLPDPLTAPAPEASDIPAEPSLTKPSCCSTAIPTPSTSLPFLQTSSQKPSCNCKSSCCAPPSTATATAASTLVSILDYKCSCGCGQPDLDCLACISCDNNPSHTE